MRKYALPMAAAVAALLFWRWYVSPPAASQPSRVEVTHAAPSAITAPGKPVRPNAAVVPVKPAAAKTGNADDAASQYRFHDPNDPRALFENPAQSVGQQFSALARLAQGGDANAKYFALQIARHCEAISKEPDDLPATGQASATPYQIQLRAKMKAACLQVMSDAAYPEYAKQVENHEAEVFADRMRQTLQLFFADKGPESAIHAAASAIAQRPDDATVAMVGDVFADLDIASVYFQPEVASAAPDDPQKRIAMTRFALNLLACHYGRPCGPNSYVVQETCLQLGACVPGADLLGVYQSQLLTPQEMNYVRLLLDYLKQFPPNVSWG